MGRNRDLRLDRDWQGPPRDGAAQAGPRLTVAWVLVMSGLDVIHRRTLRALLPPGTVKKDRSTSASLRRARDGKGVSVNQTSKKFQDGLAAFERSGWIRRGQEYVLVADRQGLTDYLAFTFDGRRIPQRLIDLQPSIDMLRDDALAPHGPNPEAQAQRYRELQALDRLMRQAPVAGANRSGAGSVRRVGPAGSGR